MPVVGSNFRGRRERNLCLFKLAEPNKQQGADTSQQVNRMRSRENVKEAAGLVARDVHALRYKLAPRNELPSHKEKTKHRSHQPEFAKAAIVRKIEPLSRGLKSETACEENAGVGPKNARKMDGHPKFAAAAQNDKSAGQRHEKHQNGNNANRNRGGVALRRGSPPAAAIAIVAASIAIIASAQRWRGAAPSTADVFDDDFDIRNCACARHGESFLFSELYSPALRALTTCSGARCCGTKSSAASGTLNS